jgi:hypothetical protein
MRGVTTNSVGNMIRRNLQLSSLLCLLSGCYCRCRCSGYSVQMPLLAAFLLLQIHGLSLDLLLLLAQLLFIIRLLC